MLFFSDTSEPVTGCHHFSKRRQPRRKIAAFAALALASLTIMGCDRQKPAPPQAIEAGDALATGPQRYQIDRSHAGTAIADIAVRGTDGRATSLRALIGKPVVLNLWATWCAPCIEELPTLNRLASIRAGRLHVVALSQDIGEDSSVPAAFLAQRGWAAIAAWHDPANAAGLYYGGSLPTTILFAADGDEVVRVIGPLDWSGSVASALLAEADH